MPTEPARRAAARAIGKAAHDVLALGEVGLAHRLARLALETSDAEANLHSVMAGVLEAEGRLDEALVHWRRAVACAPDSAGQRFNLALALLRAGELAEGLALQEARYDKDKWTSLAAAGSLDGLLHRIPRPGDDLAGRRVLVFTEQGLGDCLWAARWLPRLARAGARLTLATRPALRPLLAPLAPFEEVLGPPPEAPEAKINLAALAGRFDAFLPMMSLPWLFGATCPDAEGVPWLRPDPDAVAAWRRRHEAALPGATTIAGLVWRSSPEGASAAVRSLPTEALAPLGACPGLGLVVLQGGVAEERRQLRGILPEALDDADGRDVAMEAMPAAMAATDLLITVDTMAMHLAGSMAHPAIVLVSQAAPGFVLGTAGDCGWYPSLRLLRRQPGEAWSGVVERIAPQLLAEVAALRPRG
jgi:hypothetical protein